MTSPATSPVILLAFANDRDAYLSNLQRERAGVYDSLQSLHDRGAIQVHKQEETSLDGLFKTLNNYTGRIAIIHYAGHANGTALQLETTSGAEAAHAIGLARRFAQEKALQLVFLNGCATAGQVKILLAAGVPAVIATSVKIDDAMATDFARQFYAALADKVGGGSIAAAFEAARGFIASKPDAPRIINRTFDAVDDEATPAGAIWGLYANQGADAALAWALPTEATSPTDILIERINNGSISLAEARRLAEALSLDRSPAATGPTPAAFTQNFADTVTVLATAEDPADRAAAVSLIRGDDAGAYDQLFASAEAETAKAAERFRQAGAIAAPTSVTRAIAAYARAADLDLSDFDTWIELARLHRTRGALADSRRCAEHARQYAGGDRERSLAEDELGDLATASGDLAEARRRFTASLDIADRLAAADPHNSQWQRDLSISHNRLGDLATASGDLAEARRRFTASHDIFDRLAAADPHNSQLQRDLSISHNKLGDLATASSDLAEARRRFTASLEIRERLAAADLHNSEWQRDLSISHNKLGDLATASGDLAGARRRFTASLEIRERLAAADPHNSEWQRDLSISHEKLGNLATASGDLAEARRRFTASLEIRERLAAADPHNSEWQRDLSVSHYWLGNLGTASGDLAEAHRRFTASLEITERLAAADPHNSEWQRDLSAGHNKLGNLATACGDLAEARRRFTAGLEICKRLAAADPHNSQWQRDLWYSHYELAAMAAAAGETASAIEHCADGLPIIRALAARWPDHPGVQNDLAITRRRLTELGGDPAPASQRKGWLPSWLRKSR